MKKLFRLLPHICIVLSFVMLTFLVIDMYFNHAMGFIDNMGSKYIMMALCVFTLINSLAQIIGRYKHRKQ